MPDYTKNFALNLRRFRKKNGLTQKEFAQLLGYSEKTVSKWECEGSIPDIETLFDIARNLQTSLDELFKAQDIYYRIEQYLLENGVAEKQIKSVEGMGSKSPVADNETAEGRAQNRRVEIYMYASAEMIEAANNGTLEE